MHLNLSPASPASNYGLLDTILPRFRCRVWELRSAGICWVTNKDNIFVSPSLSFFIWLHLLGLLPSSNHNCSSDIPTFTWPRLGQGNLASPTIHTVAGLWMDLVILIFFLCAGGLCLHCIDLGKERERRGRRGRKKNKSDRSPVNYLPGVWLKWL